MEKVRLNQSAEQCCLTLCVAKWVRVWGEEDTIDAMLMFNMRLELMLAPCRVWGEEDAIDAMILQCMRALT
eukprot:6149270-Amphidinium_carterae.1